jgi:mono/diheme cytochrome c family protein
MRGTQVAPVAAAAVVTGALIGGLLGYRLLGNRNDASAATVALGRSVYQAHCARCHGANLEGQPAWQQPLPSGRMPAPPHDASGHTWHHSDRLLFEITKHGTAVVVGGGYESDMPGFRDLLSDEQISAVLAFIKSTWPERERRYQQDATRNDRDRRP